MAESTGVMLTAYGTPRNLGEVEDYFRSIRGGRQPSPEEVQNLTERYRRVGGQTPLLKITQDVATALDEKLNGGGEKQFRVYLGMKHWHPFISDTLSRIAEEGVDKLIALPMAPHFSEMSIGGYRTAVEDGLRVISRPLPVRIIESWHANPMFIETIVGKINKALKEFSIGQNEDVEVVFSAHSLPKRIRQWDDPYQSELLTSCEAVAKAAGLTSWGFAFQSAGHTGECWLGPDILEALGSLASKGKKRVLVVSIGFVTDNLEIIYDLDVEAQELAQGLAIELRRAEMPNASPEFIGALADIVINGAGARISDVHVEAAT